MLNAHTLQRKYKPHLELSENPVQRWHYVQYRNSHCGMERSTETDTVVGRGLQKPTLWQGEVYRNRHCGRERSTETDTVAGRGLQKPTLWQGEVYRNPHCGRERSTETHTVAGRGHWTSTCATGNPKLGMFRTGKQMNRKTYLEILDCIYFLITIRWKFKRVIRTAGTEHTM